MNQRDCAGEIWKTQKTKKGKKSITEKIIEKQQHT